MNNSNSLDNSRSNSSDSPQPEVREEQRSLALLPAAFPFEVTERYQSAFGSDALVPLPASYRLDYWQKHTGDLAWQRAQEEAATYNRKAHEQHAKKVAEIDAENARRQERNRVRLTAHQEAKVHHTALTWKYEIELKAFEKRLEREGVEQARRNLDRVLLQQADAIRDAVKQVITITLRQMRETCSDGLPDLRKQTVLNLNTYRRTRPDHDLDNIKHIKSVLLRAGDKKPKLFRFLPYGAGIEDDGDDYIVHFPLCFPDATPDAVESLQMTWHPFGAALADDALNSPGVLDAISRTLNAIGCLSIQELVRVKLLSPEAISIRREHYMELLDEQLKKPEVLAYLSHMHPDSKRGPRRPAVPQPPSLEHPLPAPNPPSLQSPKPPEPPAYCFDTPEKDNIEHVFKGSQVYGIEQVATLARTHLFDGKRVRPYFVFGGVPFPISGGSPHMLIVGMSGSGKTTTLLRLMSSRLPLSRAQGRLLAKRVLSGKAPYPESSHQWGRSLTHQAVVYNAKGEYLRFLEAFGFDSNVDLFNLDPAEPDGWAWDVAVDINDPESIEKFVEHLIPMSTAATRDKNVEFWLGAARTVLEAIIVSFRNAARHAGQEPSWTVRDLVTAVSTDESIRYILRWHDTPVQKLKECFGLSEAQTSSIIMTLRECMRPFRLVGNRWYHAKNRGRAISLKKWTREGARSVLVLPNTKANVSAYGPLNKSLFKALTDLWLKDENAFYADDDGKQRTHQRYIFIDELGQAGQFDELDRLMGEGRYFGINVILGLHQLSQIRETYGENVSETIIGLCSYLACLKSRDPRTQKWMSELIGRCLRSYEKESFSYTTSEGQTLTESNNTTQGHSSGTNESRNTASTRGTSDTAGSSLSRSHSEQRSSTSPPQPGQRSTTTRGTSDSVTETTNESHTENESTTQGITTGSSHQSNWSTSHGKSKALNTTDSQGTSKTRELRGEAAIEPHEFGTFPDPETTGKCEGVYLTPSLPVWRTTLTLDQVQPEYAFPEKLNQRRVRPTADEDELVSKSVEWDTHDLERLYLDKPHTLPAPKMLMLPECNMVGRQPKDRVVERQSLDDQPLHSHLEDADDDEPPLADFNY